MKITIKDVALAAGVSPASVSRALGKGPISRDAKEKIDRAVAMTGYRPNLSARRLRSQNSATIGLIVADICNPFFTAVCRSVEESAHRGGLRVLLCNTDEDPERERMYLELMQEEQVTGAIVAPTQPTGAQYHENSFNFPIVLVDRGSPGGAFDSVVLDNHLASTQLVQHVISRGYRRIGGMFGNTSTTGAERCDGFKLAMDKANLVSQIRFVPPNAQAAESEARAWLQGSDAPEALIVSNSLLLIGVVKAIRTLNLAIPGDLALAGFDNEVWTELVGPGITVIEQPVNCIGQTAVQMLIERQKFPDLPPRKVVLGGRCIIRPSTSMRPSRA